MLKLDKVSKFYLTEGKFTRALDKISLEFHTGEFVAITGESGSGKSTLLNIISGLDTFEEGEISIDGRPYSSFTPKEMEEYRKKYISFIFQNYNLIDSYTVLENILTSFIINGLPLKEAKIKAIEILTLVGLKSCLKNRGSQLSGGQKQRLAIARALAKNCHIIVADEPTGNLDSVTSKEIIELLYKISQDHLVIMVTHNYKEAIGYVNRKIRIFDGSVVQDKTYKEISLNNEPFKTSEPLKTPLLNKVSWFVYSNMKNQPHKTTFLGVVIFILVCFISVLIGFYTTFTNTIAGNNNNYYTNDYKERVVATKHSEIFDEDVNNIASLNHVVNATKYSYAIDCYALPMKVKSIIEGSSQEDKDYNAGIVGDNRDFDTNIHPDLENEYRKVLNVRYNFRSVGDLNKRDLIKGRLPENEFEVVLASSTPAVYKQGETTLSMEYHSLAFRSSRFPDVNDYSHRTVKIVGLVERKDFDFIYAGESYLSYIHSLVNLFNYNASVQLVHYGSYGNFANLGKIKVDETVPDNVIKSGQINMVTPDGLVLYFNNERYDFSDATKYQFVSSLGNSPSANLIMNSKTLLSVLSNKSNEISMSVDVERSFISVSKVLNKKGYTAISPFRGGAYEDLKTLE
ncbi:MAG: ABC transporter ATP-binding protein, partial [Bacillales bacterium]|nr:ABC transporter ATP-binding protein [Bacillales bacterium]